MHPPAARSRRSNLRPRRSSTSAHLCRSSQPDLACCLRLLCSAGLRKVPAQRPTARSPTHPPATHPAPTQPSYPLTRPPRDCFACFVHTACLRQVPVLLSAPTHPRPSSVLSSLQVSAKFQPDGKPARKVVAHRAYLRAGEVRGVHVGVEGCCGGVWRRRVGRIYAFWKGDRQPLILAATHPPSLSLTL